MEQEYEAPLDQTWDVPGQDPGNTIWIAWNPALGGYYVRVVPPEGDAYDIFAKYANDEDIPEWERPYAKDEPFTDVPTLILRTLSTIDWDEVSPQLVRELEAAPRLAWTSAKHSDRRAAQVAAYLGRVA
ncbi:UNVERIFIED_CONTAM: hypothetical protein RF653_09950 [Kocuria sp. CPCC 205316]|uniref:hypothetical protein n=1 Tax=Kocuria TaxID=57493 RepID=UPI0036D88418